MTNAPEPTGALVPALPENHLVWPVTGEIVDLSDPADAAAFVQQAGEIVGQLRDAIAWAKLILVDESRRQGTKTLYLAGRGKVTVSGGPTSEYDVEALREGLREAGLPEERLTQVIRETVEYKPMVGELKKLAAANPDYRDAIERARIEVLKPHTVKIDPKGA